MQLTSWLVIILVQKLASSFSPLFIPSHNVGIGRSVVSYAKPDAEDRSKAVELEKTRLDSSWIRKSSSVVTGVVGAATTQLSVNKAMATVGFVGAITNGVADGGTFIAESSQSVRDNPSSYATVVFANEQSSMLHTSPHSQISSNLPTHILAEYVDDTSIVDKMIEQIANVNENNQAERINEVEMKEKIQELKKQAQKDAQQLVDKQDQTSTDTKSNAMQRQEITQRAKVKSDLNELQEKENVAVEQRAQTKVEGDRLLNEQNEAERVASKKVTTVLEADVNQRAQQEVERKVAEQRAQKEKQEAKRDAAKQRAQAEADAKLKEQQETDRDAAEQRAQAQADVKLKKQQEADREAAKQRAEAERKAAEQRAQAEADAKLKERQEEERKAAEQRAQAEADAKLKERQEEERKAAEQRAQTEADAKLKEQQEEERKAAEQRAQAEADAKLKERQEEERKAAEQRAQAEADAKLKEQQEAERKAAEQRAQAEADAKLKEQQVAERKAAEQRAQDEAEAKLKEQQEAERKAAEQRVIDESKQKAERAAAEERLLNEEIASLKTQLEAERQVAEKAASKQKAQEEALTLLKSQQEAERVAIEAARIAEQEKLQQEREVARIEAERIAEEKLLAKLEKEEKSLIESISKLEAQVIKQEEESAKIQVERLRQEEALAKLEAEEKLRTEQIERIDAQVSKLEKEADEAKLVLERLRKVEQAREDDAKKAIESRKALVAKIDLIKSLPLKTLSDFKAQTPRLQDSLDVFKSNLPSIPTIDTNLATTQLASIPPMGQKLVMNSSFKDLTKDVPEYAVLFAASAMIALFVVITGGLTRNKETNDENGSYLIDDSNVSTPYGLRGQVGSYSPSLSTLKGQSNTFPKSSKATSFGPSPSQAIMSSKSATFEPSPITKSLTSIQTSNRTMQGNGAGSGFTQTPKGSFGSTALSVVGGVPGGTMGGLPKGNMSFGKQGGYVGASFSSPPITNGPMKGSIGSFGTNQILQSGSTGIPQSKNGLGTSSTTSLPQKSSSGNPQPFNAKLSEGDSSFTSSVPPILKGGGISSAPLVTKGFTSSDPSSFAKKDQVDFRNQAPAGGLGNAAGVSASSPRMSFGQKSGGGVSKISTSFSGSSSSSSAQFLVGPSKGSTTGFMSKQGEGLGGGGGGPGLTSSTPFSQMATSFSDSSSPSMAKGFMKGTSIFNKGQGEGDASDVTMVTKSATFGDPPSFPPGPMKGSSSGFLNPGKTFGKNSYKQTGNIKKG